MEYLTRRRGFDRVYLIVSPQNPLKDAANNLTARERYLAAVEALRRHPELHVTADAIELDMEPPHYTIRTLDALREREPDHEFTLVIGADNLSIFHKWKSFERILREYGVVVFPREGYDAEALRLGLISSEGGEDFRIQILDDAPLVNISSTQIREGIREGRDMSSWLM